MKFEIEFLKWIQETIKPYTEKIFEFITFFGEQYILILLMIFIYFIYSKKAGQRVAFSVFGSLLLNNAMKLIIARPRPFIVDPQIKPTEVEPSFSFPSGHTQNASIAYSSIALLCRKRVIWIICGSLIFLVAISRMVLGVHYPTDVLAGAVLGIGGSFLGFFLHKKTEHDFKKQLKLYLLVAILFLPIFFLFWNKVSNPDFYNNYRDFYISYSFYLGYITASYLENRFVNFDCNKLLKIRIIRAFGAIAVAILFLFGLDILFPETVIFDMIRYFAVALMTLAVYPILTKKWLF